MKFKKLNFVIQAQPVVTGRDVIKMLITMPNYIKSNHQTPLSIWGKEISFASTYLSYRDRTRIKD